MNEDDVESVTNKNYFKFDNNNLVESYNAELPLQLVNLKHSKVHFKNVSSAFQTDEVQELNETLNYKQQLKTNLTSKTLPKEQISNEEKFDIFFKRNMQKNQSRKLPSAVISLIMLITGILRKKSENKNLKSIAKIKNYMNFKGLISTFIYLFTMLSGLIFAITNIWYLIGDALSEKTNTTLFSKSVTVVLSLIWSTFGTYSINVLYNLFITKDLEDSIRLKTKSYFKIPASLLLIILIGIFLYSLFKETNSNDVECVKIELHIAICNIKYYFMYIYGILTIFWTYLVALTIMIINRTNTIHIRRFLFDLDYDSLNIARINYEISSIDRKQLQSLSMWASQTSDNINMQRASSAISIVGDENEEEDINNNDIDYDDEEENTVINANLKRKLFKNLKNDSQMQNQNKNECSACINRFTKITLNSNINLCCEHIKSPNSIFQDYWKIASNLKLISNLTQRWVFTFLSTTLLWCVACLIGWIGNSNPSLISVIQFIVPLAILAVICGTFAECNAEGNKIIRVINPLEERIKMLYFMQQNPLQIRMYGFSLDYSAEVKFIGAISIGFLSQIIYHEINS